MGSSSQIKYNKSLLVIGAMNESACSTNPKLYGVSDSTHGGFSKKGLKRDSINYEENGETNSKKPRTTSASDNSKNNPHEDIGKSIVVLDPTPLSIIEPAKPKLSRQFWKAGDDEEHEPVPSYCSNDAAVRVHPQFLHANATSHKWALGALAELLDNSLDEVCNGATYVHVDSMKYGEDNKSSILIVEDNGGGMDPSRFRECLSLGYSRKRNMANTVGQYGNGFKTSTMRLGADAIVFSRCRGTNGNNITQSIGMLSYTFLYETRKCEAIVPTIDFELVDNDWNRIIYNSTDEWFDNLETIVKWSPYSDQQELFGQFEFLEEQGTRIVIYNLWEDDEGKLELDFDTDPHDIQLRGVNRDEKNIEMAKAYPNSRHFLTYRHSLRSYASILYLRLPQNFRIILRGKEVKHHNLLDDMMMTEDKIYRPVRSPEWSSDEDVFAALKIGFVKDARHHIDIQGFNVYHKNRLIKPFWRVWNAAGSDGRGVIGILEANFIQPAHNKQGFERTSVLAKIENRLIQYQKTYWSSRCHEIGYAQRRKQKTQESFVTETTRQREQRTEVPLNNINHDKGASSSAGPPAQFRQNADNTPGRNRNSQESVADIKPVIELTNGKHGLGISSNETGSVNLAAELQKVKYESAKSVAELERQKAQLELQLKVSKSKKQDSEKSQKVRNEVARVVIELQKQRALVDELQRRKSMLESQLKDSKAKIHDLEKSQKMKDESVKLVANLNRHKALLELQLKESKAKIQDLEKSQKMRDESVKLVADLNKHKALLELQLKDSKAKIQDLEKSQKMRDELAKVVADLNKHKALLESQLKDSKAKIQDLEKSKKMRDESAKVLADLNKHKALLEMQLKDSKTKIQDLEKSHKVQDELKKLVTELQRQKELLESQLKDSKAMIQYFEKSHKSVMDIFQEERTRRDLTEDDLRKRLRGASDAIDKLTKELNSLKAEKAYSKMNDAKCNKHSF